jgi:hypothetical protein
MDFEGSVEVKSMKVNLAPNSINTVLGIGSPGHPIRQILMIENIVAFEATVKKRPIPFYRL